MHIWRQDDKGQYSERRSDRTKNDDPTIVYFRVVMKQYAFTNAMPEYVFSTFEDWIKTNPEFREIRFDTYLVPNLLFPLAHVLAPTVWGLRRTLIDLIRYRRVKNLPCSFIPIHVRRFEKIHFQMLRVHAINRTQHLRGSHREAGGSSIVNLGFT